MGDLDRTIRRDNDAGEVQFYIRYLTSSRDYKLGQEQELKNSKIEIGRDSTCDIRYDNKQNTVSRPVNNSWYLSHGDIIQLSFEGPKLEFIVKTVRKAPSAPTHHNKEPKVIIKEVKVKENDDELETVYQILSFCIPFIGAIIWLVNIKSSPNKAKSACTAALIGIGFSFLINVIAGAS